MLAQRAVPEGVEVWTLHLAAIPEASRDRWRAWLSEDEREKLERIAGEDRRTEYLGTRALVRWSLSQYVPGVAPAEWRFERTASGRPFTVAPCAAPCFNLSNAVGVVVCAVSARPVGVDVEPLTRGDELASSKVFSPRERVALEALEASDRSRRAVELWTAKEAYLKARGEGIVVRLDRLTIHVEPASPARWALGDASALGDDPCAWQLDVRELPGPPSGEGRPPSGEGRLPGEHCIVAVALERGHGGDLPIAFLCAALT